MTNRDQRRLFHVVHFIELPFEGIDDYVCVPNSWLILRRSSNGKVVVTYPDKEDPFDTRDRVKRKEKPNDEWRFYMARNEYESDDYKDAEYWIASRNNYEPSEEESKIKDTQPDPKFNKKLRQSIKSYASQSFLSSPISVKPQLSVKPYKNSRKPLPRILIKRSLSQKPDKNLNNKRLKLNENANSAAVTDHTIASGCSEQEQSIIITENEFIQIDQAKTSSALNGKINTEQSNPPGVIKENQSVKMSIQSTSTKLTAEQHPSSKLSAQQQLSPQPPIEQQLLPQPTTGKKPSPHPIIDRQPSSNIADEQHPSSKRLVEQQASPIGQDDQQPLSMSVIDQDESDEDIESCQNDLSEPVTEERLSTKTSPNILEQALQPEPMNEKSTQLVRHEHLLLESHPQDGSAEQPKKFHDSQKTHLHGISTAPRMELRPPSTANQPSQHLEHFQLPIFPVSSISNSELRSAEFVGKNSIKVAGDHQIPCSQDCRDNTPSTSYHGHNWGMLFEPVAKKQSAAVKNLKNPVDKKTRLRGNSKNITTMQYPLSSMMHLSVPGNPAVTKTAPPTQNYFRQAHVNGSQVNDIRYSREEKSINQEVPVYQGIANPSPAQNSKLAHQYRPFVRESREQQYVPTQADYLQQFACVQEMLKRQIMSSTIDRRAYHQNATMNGGFVVTNPMHQPAQFLPQNENQYIPVNSAYAQEVIRHDLMRGSTNGAHNTYNPNVQNGVKIQLVDRYSSNQLHQNSEHLQQKQYPLIYQDQCPASTQNDLALNKEHSSHMPKPQKITERPRSLSTSKSLNRALLEAQQRKIDPNSTKYRNMNLAAVPENLMVELAPSTKDAEVHTMTSSEIPHETQITLNQRNHTHQLPRINKTMVDQATETDLMMNGDHCINKIAGSSVGERASKLVDSACQTDEWLIDKQGSTYQETASDSKTAAEQEIESENELDSEVYDKNLTNVRNVTPKDQQVQYRIFAEQDMLNAIGSIATRVGTNFSVTRDILNFYRNSTLECIQEYETLIKKVDKFNSIETLQIPIPPPNNVTSEVPQVTQEKPTGDNDNNTGVGDAVTPICEQRGKFSLPAEYDPNDTKWTLKYRENKPGLVELIPRTGVYVCRKELRRCLRQSNDCRTLARLLLTEIFSQNALSVCSLTGGKAKAFNSLNIDVRPGLDEHARLVLLTFVEEHGKKQGWVKFDTPAVMSRIRTKINEIRAKHGQPCKA